MKTKIKNKFVWVRASVLINNEQQFYHWDSKLQEYRYLDNRGYETENDAVDALLKFVGEDIYMYDNFTLVKTYRVVDENDYF